MNDHRLPPDELASAFLDGELGASGVDAVRGNPDLAARATALRHVAAAVGEQVAVPPGAEDAAVAAALADFDSGHVIPLSAARQRSRGLVVIGGIAAAVAVGFIVAAAAGLFAERDRHDVATVASPRARADEQTESQAAPQRTPSPAAADESTAFMQPEAPTAMSEEQTAAESLAIEAPADDEAEAAVAEQQTAAEPLAIEAPAGDEADGPQAGAAVAEQPRAALGAMEEDVAATESERAAAVAAPAPAVDDPVPPGTEDAAAAVMADVDQSLEATPRGDDCAAAADATIELSVTAAEADIIIIRTPDGQLAALDAATCREIPTDDDIEAAADLPADACAATIELSVTAAEADIIIIRTPDGQLAALDAATCREIPAKAAATTLDAGQ